MLQRFDIARDKQSNCISIKEFAVLETKSHKRQDYKHTAKDYSLVHEVSFDGDLIHAAIKEGQKALISELRSGSFFPIHPCAELIANRVTALFNGNATHDVEVFFDDRTILSTYEQE
jgi:hypothetical protein